MEWLKDNTNIWIVIVLLFICFFWGLSSTVALNKAKGEIQENRSRRSALEANYDSLLKSKLEADEKIELAQEGLKQERDAHAVTNAELNRERIVLKTLKEKIEETINLNERLEGELEKCTASCK